jgi:hypothetical protein
MSTAVSTRISASTSVIRPQQFSTLTMVEVRKMISTRGGLAVLGTVLAIALTGIAWKLFHTSTDPVSWANYTGILPIAIIALAMIGLLGMTAEWTQRTALTTFTLSPRRGRVLTAKFVASIGLALGALVVVFALIVAGVAVGGLISGQTPDYSGLGRGIVSFTVIGVLEVTMAAGFGALSAQTAVAVAAYFVAPTIWAAVGPALFQSTSGWLDIFQAMARLSSTDPWADLAQSLTAICFWIVLPTTIGVVRSMRREVK